MSFVHDTVNELKASSPAQSEFYQAVEEVLESLSPLLDANPRYREAGVIERLVEPERQIMFRVCWADDQGQVHVNKGYRVEFNSVLGPYKGGLRFHPSVNAGIVKFLGFEQIFKNALTGLPIGGGKGGANFNPKGRSDHEIMRFCQAYMSELYRHIGPVTDVPAGDIGVGAREIGYLFGQYKRLTGRYEGVLTGKGLLWGGSLGRPEATGFGCVYFAQNMLRHKGDTLTGKRCLVSGAGNVAIHTIEKLQEVGAVPVTCSDSSGTLYCPNGIDAAALRKVKLQKRQSLKKNLEEFPDAEFTPTSEYPEDGHAVWRYQAQVAFPCATQNEVTVADAQSLLENGCLCVSEGANMPTEPAAVDIFLQGGILYGPGKAANAGGVTVSQLEMSQNASMQQWSFAQIDKQLQTVMAEVYNRCSQAAREFDQPNNLVLGANVAGFRRVVDAMLQQGVV